jgi:hypothetical protein
MPEPDVPLDAYPEPHHDEDYPDFPPEPGDGEDIPPALDDEPVEDDPITDEEVEE